MQVCLFSIALWCVNIVSEELLHIVVWFYLIVVTPLTAMWIKMGVDFAVDVTSSYIAAKTIGEDFGLKDVAMAGVNAMASAMTDHAIFLNATFNFIISVGESRREGYDWEYALEQVHFRQVQILCQQLQAIV